MIMVSNALVGKVADWVGCQSGFLLVANQGDHWSGGWFDFSFLQFLTEALFPDFDPKYKIMSWVY